MIYRLKATIDGNTIFMREYEVRGDSTLFSLHLYLQSDLSFAPDQIVLFRSEDRATKTTTKYDLFGKINKPMDKITIASLFSTDNTSASTGSTPTSTSNTSLSSSSTPTSTGNTPTSTGSTSLSSSSTPPSTGNASPSTSSTSPSSSSTPPSTGSTSLFYIYNTFKNKELRLELLGIEEPLSRRSYPRLVAEKGKNPDQFSESYDDFDFFEEEN